MTVKIRAMGEPDEVARTLALLDQVLEVAYDGRTYPCRGSFGVRVYCEVRPPQAVRADAARDTTPALPADARRIER